MSQMPPIPPVQHHTEEHLLRYEHHFAKLKPWKNLLKLTLCPLGLNMRELLTVEKMRVLTPRVFESSCD